MDAASYGFVIDLDHEMIHFNSGYSVPIVSMLDRYGEETDDIDEVVFVKAIVPPDGKMIGINLHDLNEEDLTLTTH